MGREGCGVMGGGLDRTGEKTAESRSLDLAALRRVAEAATREKLRGVQFHATAAIIREFREAFDPPTVLALIDRIEALEGALTLDRAINEAYRVTRERGDWDGPSPFYSVLKRIAEGFDQSRVATTTEANEKVVESTLLALALLEAARRALGYELPAALRAQVGGGER